MPAIYACLLHCPSEFICTINSCKENLNCGCSAILCGLNVLFINNSPNKPLLYISSMCFFFFLLFVVIPCVFSFVVGVGLRNSICIFLERFCNLVTNRKSGRVQCLIDVGRWKVRAMCPASAGWWEQYFCSYRRNCTWYGKSATTPIISFFRGENADFWAHRGGISAVSKVSNNGSRVWWYFASSYHLGATCKSFPVFFL